MLLLFHGRPLLVGRAVVNGASEAVSAALAGFHPYARTWLAATVPVAPPLSRRGLRSRHSGKRPPECVAQRRFAHALFVVAAGACPLSRPVPCTRLSPFRRGLIQPQPSPPVQGGNVQPTKLFAQKQAKTFAGCPRTVVSGRGRDAPCGEGSQTGDGG